MKGIEARPDKGLKGGSCNRVACQQPGADWYNHSTRAWYCTRCAIVLNEVNADAFAMFGHPLCTKGERIKSDLIVISRNDPTVHAITRLFTDGHIDTYVEYLEALAVQLAKEKADHIAAHHTTLMNAQPQPIRKAGE